jgi:hypothetical protein
MGTKILLWSCQKMYSELTLPAHSKHSTVLKYTQWKYSEYYYFCMLLFLYLSYACSAIAPELLVPSSILRIYNAAMTVESMLPCIVAYYS